MSLPLLVCDRGDLSGDPRLLGEGPRQRLDHGLLEATPCLDLEPDLLQAGVELSLALEQDGPFVRRGILGPRPGSVVFFFRENPYDKMGP